MLVLVEGVPGSGKSSTAHFLKVLFEHMRIPVKWWYEEESGHPVYCFHDEPSLQAVIADLSIGKHERVIAAALAQWRRFANSLRSSETIVILDSCLFGYLTWSLFPVDVSEEQVRAYVERVERIILSCDPRLIYLRQHDLADSLERMCGNRGSDVATKYVEHVTQSPYAKRRGLRGFAGMVEYWTDYRNLTDRLCDQIGFPKLMIENSAGDWPAYYRQMADFLSLSPPMEVIVSEAALRRYAGSYKQADGEVEAVCQVRLEDDSLFLYNLPGLWERNRLVPKSANVFYIDSLPFGVTFEPDTSGAIQMMRVSGASMMLTPMGSDRTFMRTDLARSDESDDR